MEITTCHLCAIISESRGLRVIRAAEGRYIGAYEIGNGIWNVYYRDVLLGYFDEKLIQAKETYLHINNIKV